MNLSNIVNKIKEGINSKSLILFSATLLLLLLLSSGMGFLLGKNTNIAPIIIENEVDK